MLSNRVEKQGSEFPLFCFPDAVNFAEFIRVAWAFLRHVDQGSVGEHDVGRNTTLLGKP